MGGWIGRALTLLFFSLFTHPPTHLFPKGVTSATQNRKSYCALFELLYPDFFPVFVRAAETWFDAPEVTTPLLKFLQEFVYNRAQRLMFDQSSPNGTSLSHPTTHPPTHPPTHAPTHRKEASIFLLE